MTRRLRPNCSDAGFTLVELLASIAILGVISFGLTEAVIVGLKTTDGTVSRSANSVTTEVLNRYFSADAENAQKASSPDGTCAPTANPPAVTHPVVQLDWTATSGATTASYWLRVADPTNKPGEQDLVRQLCTQGASSSAAEKALGHFSVRQSGDAVTAACDSPPVACPSAPSPFHRVTLDLHTGAAGSSDTLTMRRRTT